MPLYSSESHESITKGSRALDCFTDRDDVIRRFAHYLHAEPSVDTIHFDKILFFYGAGGNGKSLLLRYLREKHCRRVRDWASLLPRQDHQALSNQEFTRRLTSATTAQPIPYAWHDFGQPPMGDDRPQEAFSVLQMLRRVLTPHGLRFPLYDYASLLYLRHTQQASKERLRSFFPGEEMDTLASLVDTLSTSTYGSLAKAVLQLLGTRVHLDQHLSQFLQRRPLGEDQLHRLERMDVTTELVPSLPRLFAEDLNTSMGLADAPERIVLFFDSHEALWGYNRDSAAGLFFARDEWLRLLLRTVDRSKIVTVVAGRERPRWPEATENELPEDALDLQLVGNLSAADGRVYLGKVGIVDTALCNHLLDYTRVEVDQVHPLFLGLCADIVLAAKMRGITLTAADFQTAPDLAKRALRLAEVLLKWVDKNVEHAIPTLSACRAFNRNVYFMLAEKFRFGATESQRSTLTSFSFVQETHQRGEGWYRIHELLRRIFRELKPNETRQADEALEQYYRQGADQGDEVALVEAIYHANQLEWERGIDEWCMAFKNSLTVSRYEWCATLLTVLSDLEIATDFWRGIVSSLQGQYFATLSRHAEAREAYGAAIAAFDAALALAPNEVTALNNKGLALQRRGNLEAQLAQHGAAQANYTDAITAYDAVLALAPNDVYALNNKGTAFQRQGDLEVQLAHHITAQASYTDAIAAFNATLALAPHDVGAFNNKGLALQHRGDLEVQLAQHAAAQVSYTDAITAYNAALVFAPDYAQILNNKGTVLQHRGDLEAQLAQHAAAQASYTDAIAAYNATLVLAPNYVDALNNKGLALQRRGDLEAQLAEHTAAQVSYTDAIAAFDAALVLAPHAVGTLNNKGLALLRRGDLEVQLAQHAAAQASYADATIAFDAALVLAPNYIATLNNKGLVLLCRGDLEVRLAQNTAAQVSYTDAIIALDAALALAPNYVHAHNNKGNALASRGALEVRLAKHTSAQASYTDAVVAFDAALALAPNNVGVLNNKGMALQNWGNLEATQKNQLGACGHWQGAVATWARSLALAPEQEDMLAAHDALQRVIDATCST